MIIELQPDTEQPVKQALASGRYRSVDEMIVQAHPAHPAESILHAAPSQGAARRGVSGFYHLFRIQGTWSCNSSGGLARCVRVGE